MIARVKGRGCLRASRIRPKVKLGRLLGGEGSVSANICMSGWMDGRTVDGLICVLATVTATYTGIHIHTWCCYSFYSLLLFSY